MQFFEMPETHDQGMLNVYNMDEIQHSLRNTDVWENDLGIQISRDGRVWVCVNGIALVRFKPASSVSEPR